MGEKHDPDSTADVLPNCCAGESDFSPALAAMDKFILSPANIFQSMQKAAASLESLLPLRLHSRIALRNADRHMTPPDSLCSLARMKPQKARKTVNLRLDKMQKAPEASCQELSGRPFAVLNSTREFFRGEK